MKYLFSFVLLNLLSISVFAQVENPDVEIDLDVEMGYDVEAPMDYQPNRLRSKYIDGKFALTVDGKQITEPIYDRIPVIMTDACIVIKNGKYGVLNSKGLAVIPAEYDSVGSQYNYGQPRTFFVKKNGLYGLFTNEGKQLHPIKYKRIYVANGKNTLIVKNQQDQMELVNSMGKIIDSDFDFIQLYINVAFIYKNGKAAFVTSTFHSGFIYDSLSVRKTYYKPSKNSRYKRKFSRNYLHSPALVPRIIVRNGDKVGLVDTLNQVLVPIENTDITFDRTRGYYVIKKNYKKGYLKGAYLTHCNKYIEPIYEVLYTDGMKYIEVRKDRKWGMIDDATGELLILCQYDDIYKTDTTFVVTLNGKKGVANKYGKILIPTEYDAIDNLGGFLSREYDGVYKVRKDTLEGLVKYTGEVLIPVEFEWVSSFEERFIIVSKEDKYGLYSKEGKMVQEPRFYFIQRLRTYSSQLFITATDGGFGALDLEGKAVLENEYKSLSDIFDCNWDLTYPDHRQKHDYLRIENKKGKMGVLDINTAKMSLPCIYSGLYQYQEINADTSYFLVKKGRKFGVVDQNNQVIIDFNYDSLSFHNLPKYISRYKNSSKSMLACKKKKYGVVNLNGEICIPFEYKRLAKISDLGIFAAKKDDFYMIIDEKGQVLNPGPFDHVTDYDQGKALTFYQGKAREIDIKGIFTSKDMEMNPHAGFNTMYEVKMALIQALESEDDSALYYFAQKIAPSPQIIHFLLMHKKAKDTYTYMDYNYIVAKYYTKLREFKYYTWKRSKYYNRNNLYTPDYTRFREGFVMNFRIKDWAYDDTRILEKFLRNSFKINGFWISSYFMRRNF